MIEAGTSKPSESKSRPFMEIPPFWLQLGRMDEAFFSSEKSYTSVPNTIISVLVMTGFTVILTIISVIIGSLVGQDRSGTGLYPASATGSAFQIAVGIGCCGLIFTPLSFYLNNGIIYLGALLFGGKGAFSAQAYLDSLYYVPLGILSGCFSLLSVVPIAGPIIVVITTIGIGIYDLVLKVRVLKVVHQFSGGRAVGAVLAILIPVALIVVPICVIAGLMVMGPAIGDVFSSINASLLTPAP